MSTSRSSRPASIVRLAAALGGHRRQARAAGAALEGVLVLVAVDAQARPRVLGDVDARRGDRRPAGQEVLGQRAGERLGLLDAVLAGERVDDVAHRVGGEQVAVVAAEVRGAEVAAQRDVDREVAQLVAARGAGHPHQAHRRLAVAVIAERGGHRSAPPVGRVAERAQQQRDVDVPSPATSKTTATSG